MAEVEGNVISREDLELKIMELEEQLAAKSVAKGVDGITFKIAEKGGVSVLGLQRFPVTLYLDQWRRLLSQPVQDALVEFLGEHEDVLKPKPAIVPKATKADKASASNGAGITLSATEVGIIPGMINKYQGQPDIQATLMTLRDSHELIGKVAFEPYVKFRGLLGK